MSKMQNWVTAVTFAFLLTGGITAKAALLVTTNSVGATVAEGQKNAIIPGIETDVSTPAVKFTSADYEMVADRPTTLGGKVSGPNKFNYLYDAPDALVTNVTDQFSYTAKDVNGNTWTVWQNVTVTYVNDAPIIHPIGSLASTNFVYISVDEDVTNQPAIAKQGQAIDLARYAWDEEDAGNATPAKQYEQAWSNLTYVVTDQTGIKAGVLTTTSSNIVFFVPSPNINGDAATNSFVFTVSDKSGKTATATMKITIIPTIDVPVVKSQILFLEQQAGVTNGAIRINVSDIDLPLSAASDALFNTNFTYTIASGALPSGATLSTTGDVAWVIAAADTNKTFDTGMNLTIKVQQSTGRVLPNDDFAIVKVRLVYAPKLAPTLVTDSKSPVNDQNIFDGQSINFAVTAQDFNTNSVAGPDYNLNKWGMSKIEWWVMDSNGQAGYTPTITNVISAETDTTVTSSGNYQYLAGSFKFGPDNYKLTDETTNLLVAAVAYDVAGNKFITQWKVTIATADKQVVTLPEIYDVNVGDTFSNIVASVNTANTVFIWKITDTTSIKSVVPGEDGDFATTNTIPVFKALKSLKSTTGKLSVKAAAFGKYAESPSVTAAINIWVPFNAKSLTLLANGDAQEVAANTVTVTPAQAYYKPGTTVTVTVTPGTGYSFVEYPAATRPAGYAVSGVNSEIGTYTIDEGFTAETLSVTALFKSVDALMKPVVVNPGPQSGFVSVAQQINLTVINAAGNKATLTAAGLPAGMKLVGTKITGAPLSEGTSTITVTATNTKGSSSVTFTYTVAALPTWLGGTYIGWVQDTLNNLPGNGAFGTATLTIQANGKSSGKYMVDGRTYTFTTSTLTPVLVNGAVNSFTITTKYGNLSVFPPTTAGNAGEIPVAACVKDQGLAGSAYMVRTDWKADTSVTEWDGYYTVSLPSGATYGSGYLTLTVKNGSVKVAGKLADGVAVSFNTTIYSQNDVTGARYFAFLYTAPSKYRYGTFSGAVEFTLNADGEKVVVVAANNINWSNNDPTSTTDYAGFGIPIQRTFTSIEGGLFGTITSISSYYTTSLTVSGVVAPDLDYTKTITDFGDNTAKVKYTEASLAPAIEVDGAQLTPNGVAVQAGFVVAKADKPTKNKDGSYNYTVDSSKDGTVNETGLTITLVKQGTAVTGVFKGTFVSYYDYVLAEDYTASKQTLAHTAKTVRYEGVLVPVRSTVDYPEGAGFFLWSRKCVVYPGQAGNGGSTAFNYLCNESYDFQLVQ